jgi:hypothetical protein
MSKTAFSWKGLEYLRIPPLWVNRVRDFLGPRDDDRPRSASDGHSKNVDKGTMRLLRALFGDTGIPFIRKKDIP